MLQVLLLTLLYLFLTVLYLFCETIRYADTMQLTLAILTTLAALNFVDGSLLQFLNQIALCSTCLMVFDLVYKTSLAIHQPTEILDMAPKATESTAGEGRMLQTTSQSQNLVRDPWMRRPAFREVQGVFIQKTPSAGSEGNIIATTRDLNEAIDAVKRRLTEANPTSTSLPGTSEGVRSGATTSQVAGKTATRSSSLEKPSGMGTPVKPLRETDEREELRFNVGGCKC